MSLNVGKARELVELWVGRDLNPELFRELLNAKLREFCSDTGILETSAELTSVADTQEYELPADFLSMKDVIYDDYRAGKINFWNVKEFRGEA